MNETLSAKISNMLLDIGFNLYFKDRRWQIIRAEMGLDMNSDSNMEIKSCLEIE